MTSLPPPPDSIPEDWHAEEEREARWGCLPLMALMFAIWAVVSFIAIWQTEASAGGKESRSRQDETCVGSASDVTKGKSGWRTYSPWTVQPDLWWRP